MAEQLLSQALIGHLLRTAVTQSNISCTAMNGRTPLSILITGSYGRVRNWPREDSSRAWGRSGRETVGNVIIARKDRLGPGLFRVQSNKVAEPGVVEEALREAGRRIKRGSLGFDISGAG
jgi:hypothetical protein